MKRYILILFMLVSLTVQGEQILDWPDLSTVKHVSKRVATETDVNLGAAVFLLQVDGRSVGVPIDIKIPQYGIHTDGETGSQSRVVVIQAEEANGQQIIGALAIDTKEFLAGMAYEFKLLGEVKPKDQP